MTEKIKSRAEGIFNLMDAFDVLETLPRTGYLIRGVNPCENVASHSFSTAALTMLLADAESGVDVEKALRMAILHETGETLTTDIPLIAKRFIGAKAVEKAERRAEEQTLGGLFDAQKHLDILNELHECKSTEAKLVKAADKLQMLCKVVFYEKSGRRGLNEFFDNDQGMDLAPFPVAAELLKLLKNAHNKIVGGD